MIIIEIVVVNIMKW